MNAAAVKRSGNEHLLTLKNEFEDDESRSSDFSEVDGEDTEGGGESTSLELDEDNLRRRFLIGLVDDNGNPTVEERHDEDFDVEEYNRQVARASRSYLLS